MAKVRRTVRLSHSLDRTWWDGLFLPDPRCAVLPLLPPVCLAKSPWIRWPWPGGIWAHAAVEAALGTAAAS